MTDWSKKIELPTWPFRKRNITYLREKRYPVDDFRSFLRNSKVKLCSSNTYNKGGFCSLNCFLKLNLFLPMKMKMKAFDTTTTVVAVLVLISAFVATEDEFKSITERRKSKQNTFFDFYTSKFINNTYICKTFYI